jgi:hypothetical protein
MHVFGPNPFGVKLSKYIRCRIPISLHFKRENNKIKIKLLCVSKQKGKKKDTYKNFSIVFL